MECILAEYTGVSEVQGVVSVGRRNLSGKSRDRMVESECLAVIQLLLEYNRIQEVRSRDVIVFLLSVYIPLPFWDAEICLHNLYNFRRF